MSKITSKIDLEEFIVENWDNINSYIDKWAQELPLPIYSSVDIRESRNKFAPVDLNIYPAGFNNLCALDLMQSSLHFKKSILSKYPEVKKIALIPESHTKNTFYLDHLHTLKTCLANADFDVEIISFDTFLFQETNQLDLISQSGDELTIYKAEINQNTITANGQVFDLAILNNDQSNPIGLEWDKLKTPIHPTPLIGWYARKKSTHFEYYHDVVTKFCHEFNIDPNLIEAKFKNIENVDFASKQGLDKIAKDVDLILKDLPEDSNVFVKASQGTYGMGISVVSSGEEILNMNRKGRNKMDVGKNKIKFTSVLIQEGVETILKYDDSPAEVTIYLVNGCGIGGFMRANPLRGTKHNLNARGMVYQKFCISEIRQGSEHKQKEAVYSVIARLSTLASGYEILDVLNKKED